MENFVSEILAIVRSDKSDEEKKELLADYHESDIADAVDELSDIEKPYLFRLLDKEDLSEVVSFTESAEDIIEQLDDEKAADILEEMDADDAVDILENMDEDDRKNVIEKMDEEARQDVEMILSYDEDQIGHMMTTNYIVISKDDTVTSAMKKLIKQSADNDNITTIFVVDDDEKYYGALDLKDLIRARKDSKLEDIFVVNYPFVKASSLASDVYQDVIDYGEDIVPVLDDNDKLIGAITAHDLVEMVGNEMQDDYSKLAAINGSVDLDSSVWVSVKKRFPWLILLLVLGLVVSIVLGLFEGVIASLTVMVLFQSVILDMAGNSGTQSLAVTIRILSEEEVNKKLIGRMLFKELRVGLLNALLLGTISFVATFAYLSISGLQVIPDVSSIANNFIAAGVIAGSLFTAMTLSSFIGCVIPIFFHLIHVDPAVASGPLITTLNDLIAVTVYYSLCIAFLLQLI